MIIHAEGRFEAIRFRVESMRRGELLPEDNFYPELQKAIDEDTLPKDGRKEDDYHPPALEAGNGRKTDDDPEAA